MAVVNPPTIECDQNSPAEQAYLNIIETISQIPERFNEAMGNPLILILLRSICNLYPDVKAQLTRQPNLTCDESLEASANCWGIGADEGFKGKPISMLDVSYLLGWRFGAGSPVEPGTLNQFHPRPLPLISAVSRTPSPSAPDSYYQRKTSA